MPQQLAVGDICPPCNCEVGACKAGINPSNDCVRQLKGQTVWHKCETCQMFAWNNNGTCINCARVARDERKEAFQKRFEAVKSAPQSETRPPIEEATIIDPPPARELEERPFGMGDAYAEMRRQDKAARIVPTWGEPVAHLPKLTLEIYGQTIVWTDPAIVMGFLAQALGGVKK